MSNEIQIRIDPSEVEAQIQRLKNIENGAPKAVMRAMNRTLSGMRTDAAKEVSARYIVKQKDVKEKLESEKATISGLSIALRSKGRPMSLVRFKTRPNKKPGKKGSPTVYAQVRKDASGGYTGGFMATMTHSKKSGESYSNTGVFRRTGKFQKVQKGKYAGQVKETLDMLHGPGTVQMMDNNDTRESIQTKAAERFNKELDHQVDYLLKQQKG